MNSKYANNDLKYLYRHWIHHRKLYESNKHHLESYLNIQLIILEVSSPDNIHADLYPAYSSAHIAAYFNRVEIRTGWISKASLLHILSVFQVADVSKGICKRF